MKPLIRLAYRERTSFQCIPDSRTTKTVGIPSLFDYPLVLKDMRMLVCCWLYPFLPSAGLGLRETRIPMSSRRSCSLDPICCSFPTLPLGVMVRFSPLLQTSASIERRRRRTGAVHNPAGGIVRRHGAALRRHAVRGDRDQGLPGGIHLAVARPRPVVVSDGRGLPTSRWSGIRPRLHARRSDARE